MRGWTKCKLRGYPLYTYPNGEEVETLYDIVVNVHPGSPGCFYLPNGDPGYPPEPPEMDILSIKDAAGKEYGEGDWVAIGLDQDAWKKIEDAAAEQLSDAEDAAAEREDD